MSEQVCTATTHLFFMQKNRVERNSLLCRLCIATFSLCSLFHLAFDLLVVAVVV